MLWYLWGRMRVAWFSPLPPHRSGIAAYSAELLPRLAGAHAIEAFVDDGDGSGGAEAARALPAVRVLGAHQYPVRQARAPYDVTVYQLGNDLCHDYMWPYLVRYPGLVTLHDAQLHQARARGLIRRFRYADYRAEFAYCHPEVPADVATLVIAGLGGSLYYLWPMLRIAVEAAACVAVHTPFLAREIESSHPGCACFRVRSGVEDVPAAAAAQAAGLRRTLGIPDQAVVFGSFGRVTPEKRLSALLLALAQVAPLLPDLRLLVVGETPEYYDLLAEARELGVADRVTMTGYVSDAALPAYLAAVDVCVNLRWPTAHETSAAWLRCLAAAKPTIINDLVHVGDVPSLDLRSMLTLNAAGPADDPVCVSIDLVDEVPTLRRAWRLLGTDPQLRSRLGAAGRRYWEAHATLARMALDYENALRVAAGARAGTARQADARAGWPPHLRADGTAKARAIGQAVGALPDWLE
ncbi:MAG: glycosyltransferase family 4 protein [Acidobacteriota bacterium]